MAAEVETLDGTAVEQEDIQTQALVPAAPAAAPTLTVAPQVEAAELVQRLAVIRDAMNTAMIEGVDYGRIPGVDKPCLFKPGAEKLTVLFQLDIQPRQELIWGEDGHLTVISRATVFHVPTGARLGYGEGLCTTREKRYAKRKAERTCPNCGQPAVIKGKQEYGGGWLCWTKKGGCNAKWRDGDQAIEGQDAGEVDNPDLPDTWNTVIKMAEKRARVDATLAVTGASALFTQDVEDGGGAGDTSASTPSPAPEAPQPEPAPPAAPITKKRAGEIVDAAWAVGVNAQLQLAATHAHGADVGDCSTKTAAVEALRKLTDGQAAKVEKWLQRKADEQAATA